MNTEVNNDSIYNLRFRTVYDGEDKYYDMVVSPLTNLGKNIVAKFSFIETNDATNAQDFYTLKDNTGVPRKIYISLKNINSKLIPKLEIA